MPIRDEKINIPLAPKVEPVFESLKLGKYITIYSNIGRDEIRPKVKTWPMKYLVEYVSRVKKIFRPSKLFKSAAEMTRRLKTSTENFSAVTWS